jgi:hypothetical protein
MRFKVPATSRIRKVVEESSKNRVLFGVVHFIQSNQCIALLKSGHGRLYTKLSTGQSIPSTLYMNKN